MDNNIYGDEFKDKVVLVTGASSGIGAGVAVSFAKYGAKVVITGRNKLGLESTAHKCKACHPDKTFEPLQITGDMMVDDDIRRIINTTIQQFGRLDVLVNNAGGTIARTWDTLTVEEFEHVCRLNTRAPVILTKYAAPYIIEVKGCIVNVSSIAGIKASPATISYSVSKAAMDQFTRCLALELGPKGVRVNSVNPGHIVDTAILYRDQGPVPSKEDVPKFLEPYLDFYPLRRTSTVAELSPVIVFLASSKASFVHGIVLPVDGGYNTEPGIMGVQNQQFNVKF